MTYQQQNGFKWFLSSLIIIIRLQLCQADLLYPTSTTNNGALVLNQHALVQIHVTIHVRQAKKSDWKSTVARLESSRLWTLQVADASIDGALVEQGLDLKWSNDDDYSTTTALVGQESLTLVVPLMMHGVNEMKSLHFKLIEVDNSLEQRRVIAQHWSNVPRTLTTHLVTSLVVSAETELPPWQSGVLGLSLPTTIFVLVIILILLATPSRPKDTDEVDYAVEHVYEEDSPLEETPQTMLPSMVPATNETDDDLEPPPSMERHLTQDLSVSFDQALERLESRFQAENTPQSIARAPGFSSPLSRDIQSDRSEICRTVERVVRGSATKRTRRHRDSMEPRFQRARIVFDPSFDSPDRSTGESSPMQLEGREIHEADEKLVGLDDSSDESTASHTDARATEIYRTGARVVRSSATKSAHRNRVESGFKRTSVEPGFKRMNVEPGFKRMKIVFDPSFDSPERAMGDAASMQLGGPDIDDTGEVLLDLERKASDETTASQINAPDAVLERALDDSTGDQIDVETSCEASGRATETNAPIVLNRLASSTEEAKAHHNSVESGFERAMPSFGASSSDSLEEARGDVHTMQLESRQINGTVGKLMDMEKMASVMTQDETTSNQTGACDVSTERAPDETTRDQNNEKANVEASGSRESPRTCVRAPEASVSESAIPQSTVQDIDRNTFDFEEEMSDSQSVSPFPAPAQLMPVVEAKVSESAIPPSTAQDTDRDPFEFEEDISGSQSVLPSPAPAKLVEVKGSAIDVKGEGRSVVVTAPSKTGQTPSPTRDTGLKKSGGSDPLPLDQSSTGTSNKMITSSEVERSPKERHSFGLPGAEKSKPPLPACYETPTANVDSGGVGCRKRIRSGTSEHSDMIYDMIHGPHEKRQPVLLYEVMPSEQLLSATKQVEDDIWGDSADGEAQPVSARKTKSSRVERMRRRRDRLKKKRRSSDASVEEGGRLKGVKTASTCSTEETLSVEGSLNSARSGDCKVAVDFKDTRETASTASSKSSFSQIGHQPRKDKHVRFSVEDSVRSGDSKVAVDSTDVRETGSTTTSKNPVSQIGQLPRKAKRVAFGKRRRLARP